MNIFATHDDPEICARWLDDKRLGSALMECNLMMSTAIKLCDENFDEFTHVGEGMVCKGLPHPNHPVTVWVRQTSGNFDWTYHLARALDSEFQYRFGKKHGSAYRTDYIEIFRDCLPTGELLPFQNSARNDTFDFTHLPVPYSYREYLLARWATDKKPVTFTGRSYPEWYRSPAEQESGSGDPAGGSSVPSSA